MKAIERIINKAQKDRKRVVLAEATDPRVLQAARQVVDNQIAHVTLIGNERQVEQAAEQCHVSLEGIHIVSPQSSPLREVLAERLYLLRKLKGMSYSQALEKVDDPLTFANLMVREGLADGTVNGAVVYHVRCGESGDTNYRY